MSPANGPFDSATLAVLKAVFEEACNLLPPHQRSHEMRSILAVRILECAAKGERNPTRLRAYALKMSSPDSDSRFIATLARNSQPR